MRDSGRIIGTRQTLVRMAFIYGLVLHGKPCNATLVSRELEVSTKTVHRDIEFLQDAIGVPLVFNRVSNSYEFGKGHALPWWLHLPRQLPPEVELPQGYRRLQETRSAERGTRNRGRPVLDYSGEVPA